MRVFRRLFTTSCHVPSTHTSMAGMQLDSCVLNSSSFASTTHRDIYGILKANGSGGCVTRTSLMNGFKHCNREHTWALHDGGTVNCFGYSPHDIFYYFDVIAHIKRSCDKPVLMSVTGSPEEIGRILRIADEKVLAPDGIEVNLSCPNIAKHPPVSYMKDEMQRYLEAIAEFKITSSRPISVGVKLAPALFENQFIQQADLLNNSKPDFVTAINTVGHGLVIDVDTEKPLLSGAQYGGLGGNYIKAIALGNVRKLYETLDDDIDIMGCGGVSTGEDAFRHILCGAKAVQFATILLSEGSSAFERIVLELEAIMGSKGYQTIECFRGNLGSYSRTCEPPQRDSDQVPPK